jgi:hypothetical protein
LDIIQTKILEKQYIEVTGMPRSVNRNAKVTVNCAKRPVDTAPIDNPVSFQATHPENTYLDGMRNA